MFVQGPTEFNNHDLDGGHDMRVEKDSVSSSRASAAAIRAQRTIKRQLAAKTLMK